MMAVFRRIKAFLFGAFFLGLFLACGGGPAPVAAPNPAAPAAQSHPGLYAGNAYQGQMDLQDALDWITINAQDNGVYSIVMEGDQKISYAFLDYGGKKVTVSLKASGGGCKITFDIQNPSYDLFTVGAGVTFTLEDGVVLKGQELGRPGGNKVSLVSVAGGTFIMNGGAVQDNKKRGNGAGINMAGGTFIMNGGAIMGNSTYLNNDSIIHGNGGGVYLSGTFTMNGGTITENSSGNGGGVYVDGGTFTMNGGTISCNSVNRGDYSGFRFGYGGGVYVAYRSGRFIKSDTGGIIYGSNALEGQANKAGREGQAVYVGQTSNSIPYWRDTTARAVTAMNSRVRGAAGGWE